MKEIFEPILQHYLFSAPCDELRPYVEFFAESIVNDSFFTVEMFPSWTPTIYINLGNPYDISIGSRFLNISAATDVLVLRDQKVIRHNYPGDRIFTIKFHPGGLEATLGVSQLPLRQQLFLAKDILQTQLIEKIKAQRHLDDRKAIAEHYLLQGLRQKNADHYQVFVQDLITDYKTSGMQLNVNQFAEKYFTTSKTINRYFHRVIGTNPKNYFAIMRARTTLTSYAQTEGSFNPCNFGYYDLSHFYREAACFTGFPLKSLHVKPIKTKKPEYF